MIHTINGALSLYEFDSFESYLDRTDNPKYKLRRPDGTHYSYTSMWGAGTFVAALHNARHGWANCLDDIKKWSDMVVADISSNIPKPEYGFEKTGAFWDLGRVIENDPDCWLHEEPGTEIDRAGKGNIIRMVINTASSAAVRSKSHLNRCGAILALCQLLELSGFYVQFEITTAIDVDKTKLEFRTVAKRASEALNLAAVSYWCSSDMERHIDFGICETMEECRVSYGINYGSPIYSHDGGDICFDRMAAVADGVDWNDEKSVRRYIINQLKKQGVNLNE